MWFQVLVAAIAGIGIAIVLVEKKAQWPGSFITPKLFKLLSLIHPKFAEMLDCTVCTSFWTTLFCDLFLWMAQKFNFPFLWPISGFVAITIIWTVINLFNAIDPPLPKQ